MATEDRARRVAPVLVVLLTVSLLATRGVAHAPAVDATAHVVQVDRSIDTTGAVDVTFRMQAFFDSVPDNSRVELVPGAHYRMDETLVLLQRHDLVIEGNGALFFTVVPGGRRRSNVRVMNSSAISFLDLTLRGANPNGGTSSDAYNPMQEHQHGFEALSVDGFTLVNVAVTDVYGDFVYLARMPSQPPTSNVLIASSTFARSGRQGITLTAAHDVTIGRNSISDVAGATIDLEPNVSDVVDGVTVHNNAVGAGRQLFVAADGPGRVDNVTIASNDLRGQALQVWAENLLPGRRANWIVAGNDSNLSFGSPNGALMHFKGVRNLEIWNNVQPFQSGRNMVLATVTDSCGVNVHDNAQPGSVDVMRAVGSC